MAMDLGNSEFWMKKFMKECKVRDANGDGFLSRVDFEMIVERHKNMGISDDRLVKLNAYYAELSEIMGIADPSVKLTYEAAIANLVKNSERFGEFLKKTIVAHFELIDSDGNGVISFKEWVDMYTVMDVDTAHARASFDAMDANGDGVVSMEEFAAYTKEFYFSVDDTLNSSILYGPLD